MSAPKITVEFLLTDRVATTLVGVSEGRNSGDKARGKLFGFPVTEPLFRKLIFVDGKSVDMRTPPNRSTFDLDGLHDRVPSLLAGIKPVRVVLKHSFPTHQSCELTPGEYVMGSTPGEATQIYIEIERLDKGTDDFDYSISIAGPTIENVVAAYKETRRGGLTKPMFNWAERSGPKKEK